MTDYSSLQLLPLADWQAHERLCHALWMRVWKDPNTLMHGRAGQKQRGVDVYGSRAGARRPSGVQCKSKSRLIGTQITEEEVLAEVEEAKRFEPALGELIIATSAESDVQLQVLARRLTEGHRKSGLFDVHIFGWRDIVALLADYPDLVDRFYGQHVPSGGVALNAETTASLEGWHLETRQSHADIKEMLTELTADLRRPADGPAHAQLDVCRDLLDAHQYRAAWSMLDRIREREWQGASAALRFRIATNLGAAHFGLGEHRLAGERFLEAFEFDRASDKALANRALGLLLLERPTEALAAAREAVAQHPQSSRAWAALLNTLPRVAPETPLPEVPASLTEDTHLLMLRADALVRRGIWGDAEALLRQLLAQPKPTPVVKSRLAEVLIGACGAQGRFYAGACYTSAEVARLREAQDLLQQAWSEIRPTDLAAQYAHIVLNLCAVNTVLGHMTEGESAVDEALALAPEEPGLLAWKIRLAVARGDGKTAERVFARLPQTSVDDYALLEAAIARALKEPQRALAILERQVREGGDSELSGDARCQYADLVCEVDLAHAEVRFDALPQAGSARVVRSSLIFARALREAGKPGEARRYLEQARAQLSESADSRDWLVLADALSDFEECEAAVAIYEPRISTAIDTPSLRAYLRCLFELDQRQKLGQVLADLAPGVAEKAHYLHVRANLAVRSGDFPAARALLERCFADVPGFTAARFQWAEVCLREGDSDTVAQWLDTFGPSERSLSLEELLRLGPICHALNRSAMAAALFYQALRRFPHDPRPHLAFTTSVLFQESDGWGTADATVVAADTACGLRDEDGRERVFILEDLPESELQANEIAVTSPLGQRLLGKKVGDVVTLHSSGLATHEGAIVSVQHKYVHATQESLASFNTRFPESTGLIGLKLPASEDAEEQLAPIFEALRERAEYGKQVRETYAQGMPLAGLGVLMGRNSIEAWRGVLGRPDAPIRVCAGTHPEREAALAMLEDPRRRYILDPVALVELQFLSAFDAARAVCGRLSVAQATVEDLRGLIAELGRHPTGYMTVFEQDGQFFRQQVTAADVQNERGRLESLIEWVRGNCDIAPAVPRSDLHPETARGISRALGRGAYDTLLAAHGGGFTLVSDDWNLRRLAKGELGLEGIWIQPLLIRAVRAGHFKEDAYHRAVISLAGWRHHFTSISGEQLLYAGRQGRWKVTADLEALAATLGLRHSEFGANVRVVLKFLQEIWKRGADPTLTQAQALTFAVLAGVNPGRSPLCVRYFEVFRRLYERGQLPPGAWNALVGWYQGHFLPPVFTI